MDVQIDLEDVFEDETYYMITLIYEQEDTHFECEIGNNERLTLLHTWNYLLNEFENIQTDSEFKFEDDLLLYIRKDKSRIALCNDAHTMSFSFRNDQFINCIKKVIELLE